MPPPSYEAPAEHPGPYSYAWSDPRLYSGIGIGFALGGGVSGFTDSGMTDISSSDVAGLWSFRTSFGTHIPLGAEVAYVGTAADVDTFSGIPNGTLIGTTIEATARWNILPHFWFNPYLFGGIGWSHYDLTDAQFETADSGILDSDDFVEVPMGAGFSMRDVSGFMFDVRGTFRAAGSSDLVVDNDGDAADLHTWEANASLGYEF